MKTILSPLFLLLALAGTACAAPPPESVWTPDLGNGTYKNPVFFGDWPDSDVIRVGDDFYFISTSMHFVPGCPIAKSKDLVNWKMAGYALPRYDEDPGWNHPDTMGLRGSWASTIRHHKGKFYVGFAAPGANPFSVPAPLSCHFSMCVADDIKGPWKRTIFKENLYDPGLFIDDDGKAYVAHGQGNICITPLADDLLSVAGPPVKVLDNEPIEGSHMYKIKGKYYLFMPSAGVGQQVCFRSDKIYGPYEKHVVMHDTRVTGYGVHQGGLVQLKNGDWWCLIMEDRGAIGRATRLEPVTWVDGWPMIGRQTDKGEWIGVDVFKKPDVGGTFPIQNPDASDEFNAPKLGLQWQWNHNPDDANWSLTERPGYLRIRAAKASHLTRARNALTQRLQGPQCESVAELDPRGLKDGDYAGLGVFSSGCQGLIAVKQDGGKQSIEVVLNGKTVASTPGFAGKSILFKSRISADAARAAFSYSTDGGATFIPLGTPLGLSIVGWTGCRFSLFNYSATDAGVGGTADFNWFRLTDLKPPEATAQSADAPSYAASVALNGNPDTCREWVSKKYGGGTKEKPLDVWWAVETFEKPFTIQGVRILGDPRGIIPLQKNLQVQARLNGAWKTVGELKDATTKDVTVTFSAPVTTHALRVFVPGADLPKADGFVRICKFLLVLPDGTVKEVE